MTVDLGRVTLLIDKDEKRAYMYTDVKSRLGVSLFRAGRIIHDKIWIATIDPDDVVKLINDTPPSTKFIDSTTERRRSRASSFNLSADFR